MKTYPAGILIALFFLYCAPARGADPAVSVRGIPPSGAVEAGTAAVVTVELDIRSPYHINSNQPLEEYLIPTSLELDPVPDLEIGDILFPVAEIKNLEISDAPMALYEGIVKISVEVIPSAALAGRNVGLKGSVRYQACDDFTCLPPEEQPFAVKFSVVEGDAEPMERAVSGNAPVEQTDGDSGNSGLWNFDEASFPLALLLVFAGGLALNLTPCVYPMIPITITYFGGQSQGKRGSIIAHAGLYVIGMAVTYSLLGVIAALTGGLLGTALQYPPVLIGIALVMALLALSMFDVFELRMPAFLNRLAGGNRKGFAGTFLMGLTVGIVAAPCIGPFVFGLLTYVGNRGNAVLGFLLFFVLALGLGIPLLMLGIFSGSIHKLPRSGEWMVWVRSVFGFILLAMAVFFLRTLLPHPLAYPLSLALILVLAGVYLAWIAPVTGAGKGFAWLRNIVGTGFFIAALVASVTGLQSYMETIVENEARIHSAGSNSNISRTIEWIPFSERMPDGKPAMIDFYADWCAPCKELDRHTFADPDVIRLSRRFSMLKVDLTSAEDPDAEALRKRFRVLGVPTLVFLLPDGSEIENLRVTGFEPADIFLPKMEEAYRISTDEAMEP
ncbi:MAG: protein-disulfide reductase DsbD [Acidobacteria bacterium]|nr:protein-disulfide reductase DsbD [Acidobacteriota bacterium]